MSNTAFKVIHKKISAEFNLNIPDPDFEIGGMLDLDCSIRAMGFDQNETVGQLKIRVETSDEKGEVTGDEKLITLDIVTLGEMVIKGIEGTEYEDTYVEDDPKYIFENYDKLHEEGLVIDSCWLTVKVNSPHEDHCDECIEDFYVAQSIAQIIQDLDLIYSSI